MQHGHRDDDFYVLCPNARCKPTHGNGYSFSWYSSGRRNCVYCNTLFPYAKYIREHRDDGKNQKPRRADAQPPGRSHSTSRTDTESQATSSSKAKDAVVKELRDQHASNPELMEAVEKLFPPPQKSQAELRKDAFTASESARAQHLHQVKVLEEMRTSLSRKSDELLLYRQKVIEQEDRAEQAKTSAQAARAELDSIDASNSTAAAAASAAPAAPAPVYPPLEAVARQLSQLFLSKLPGGGNSEVQNELNREIANIFARTPPPPPPLSRLPPPRCPPPACPPVPQHPTVSDGWGMWHHNDLDVNEQVAIIEEEERRFRESERELAQQQHDAEMALHNLSDDFSDDIVDGDLSHSDQQAGARKTRVLPGPNDGPNQSNIDEALQLATEHASANATSLVSSSQPLTPSPPSSSTNPTSQSSQSSQPSGGGGRIRGKASGKSDDLEGRGRGGNRKVRAAPYPGPRKSSS